MLEKVFKLNQKGTTVKTELVAGLTTFLAMAYILAVNPAMRCILGNSNKQCNRISTYGNIS